MLNAILTVRQNQPRSHQGKGWEQFTDAVIKTLNDREDSIVFILWGKDAQQKAAKIKPHHLVLKAAHPSPYAAHAGFFGCRHFSKANEFLVNVGKEPVDWQIPSIAING
jgi:uracil-DNA glycosylase